MDLVQYITVRQNCKVTAMPGHFISVQHEICQRAPAA